LDTFLVCLSLITIAVPPALPLVLTVGIGISLERLKVGKIFCINPERLNFAGRLTKMCWDKTGTLTVSKLCFSKMSKVLNGRFQEEPYNFSSSFVESQPNSIERVMICCHMLANVEDTLLGHSLEVESVTITGWQVLPSFGNEANQGITQMSPPFSGSVLATGKQQKMFIFKRYEFDASLQISTVIAASEAEYANGEYNIYSKGSPEAILAICKSSSIPDNIRDLLFSYSIQGYYVIGCASRQVSHSSWSGISHRSHLESDLKFLGVILFQNPLKEESFPTMNILRNANIKSVIITGDNPRTAIHVGRQLNLCDHALLVDAQENDVTFTEVPLEANIEKQSTQSFITHSLDELVDYHISMPQNSEISITGNALNMLIEKDSEILDWIVKNAVIFARIKPDQKTWIIERMIEQGDCVGMCGDGTNDCGALKAAHVGMALSEAEASIIAPFTSAKKLVSDVLELVSEGRCALETSFVSFKVADLT
jgi:predicted P-type ATPase